MRKNFISILALVVVAGCASESVEPTAESSEPIVKGAILVPMHMQYDETGDWLMSRTAGEGAPRYIYTGIQYQVLAARPRDKAALPLYRCLDAFGTHYQSNRVECESPGSTLESLLGWVYAEDPRDGAAVQIFRCIGASGKPIVSTTELADCDPFIVQDISLGWAYAPDFVSN